jgi:hypothetical protein
VILPWHSWHPPKAEKPTSGRTTFQGADHRQDIETQAVLLNCRTYEDVRDVQIQFFKTAMDQYSAEATKLMKISTEMLAPVQKQVG